ncbi:putative RNA-directed DNA polymerase from transposon X-element [Trichonephila clavata]|uniref:Putative RNA-directed DNA polymerase from transposon X-element n=1 Tax=Trichonephila clavata TaxID=2740835 RepID=A0A8X6FT77_TRICU|nr:putative RNA-directed DNA polymerase from transposon X-element [Trichonephila clavata]GFR27797.1 putative RNA-directed DNA polymerase from transposon X-element [Trichonephila clavata]
MFSWLKNFISQRFPAIRYGEVTYNFRQNETGLPQGTVISPIIFNIFFNDLPGFLTPAVNSALFSDDLVLWDSATKKNQDSLNRTLNSALDKLAIWICENGMRVTRLTL